MTALESAILGAVQGVTEFLPVSSSAHLILVPWFFNIDDRNVDKLAFDVMLHFGTLMAILAVYGKRFVEICLDGIRDLFHRKIKDNLLLKIVVATCPAAILGLLLKDFIELYLRTPYVCTIGLFAVSILMVVAERIFVSGRSLSYPLALALGCAQALALMPGTSRSGITITVALLLGLKRTQAVDFSFLMAVPIILGSALHEAKYLKGAGADLNLYVVGAVSAFVFGFASLAFLIRYLKRHSLDVFAVYRIGIAFLILLFAKP